MQVLVWVVAVLLILIWFVLHPGHYTRGQKAMLYGVNHAHRGLHTPDKSIPENSLLAFRAAVAAGYGIELDIQLSRDGEVVVFHDDTLPRVCGKEGRVDDYTLKQLKRFHLCGTEEKIPLLTEVLTIIDGKVPMIIELKTGPRNDLLCQNAMEILRDYHGAYCIESFDPRIVRWFKKNERRILRGQLSDAPASFVGKPPLLAFSLGNLLTNVLARPQFVAYGPHEKPFLARFSDMCGVLQVCWTVHPTDDIAAKEADNDAVIFEYYFPESQYK
ncbi:MAG: glycerophosphodiester phosphodiesterase family protein [Ruthenibacterium sp.]